MIVSRIEVIADYCSDLGHPLLGGLRVTYTVDLKLTGKLEVDFLFVLIEFFTRYFRLRRYERSRILIGNRRF